LKSNKCSREIFVKVLASFPPKLEDSELFKGGGGGRGKKSLRRLVSARQFIFPQNKSGTQWSERLS